MHQSPQAQIQLPEAGISGIHCLSRPSVRSSVQAFSVRLQTPSVWTAASVSVISAIMRLAITFIATVALIIAIVLSGDLVLFPGHCGNQRSRQGTAEDR